MQKYCFNIFILFNLFILFLTTDILVANDVNEDNIVGIDDAIIALQVASNIKSKLYLPIGIEWKGSWIDNVDYKVNDAVVFNGSSYICILDHRSSTKTVPTNNPGIWDILALKGSDGNSQLVEIDPTIPNEIKDGIQWNDIEDIPYSIVNNIESYKEIDQTVLEYLKDGVHWDEIVIDSNVGIGTSTPESLLHVAGDVRIDGKLILKDNLSLYQCFILEGQRDNLWSTRKLQWTSVIANGKYEIYRNNQHIHTVDHNTLSWQDVDLRLTGSINYKLIARFESNMNISSAFTSNTITFYNTVQPEYGDGSDGIFSGGTIDRSKNYFFSSINLQTGTTMAFSGSGNGLIKVSGDMILSSGSTIILRNGANLSPGVLSFQNISKDLNVQLQNYANGGNGGSPLGDNGRGGNGGSESNGFKGETSTYMHCSPDDPTGGFPGFYPSGKGGDAKGCFYKGSYIGHGGGGGGGAAGKHGRSAENIAFIVGGNVILSGTIIGKGEDGQSGGDGGTAYYWGSQYIGGGGGGGAGGTAGHGGNVYFFCRGSYNANDVVLNLEGGKAGEGGKGGSGYVNGSKGEDGFDGIDGKLFYINTQ